MAAPTVGIVRVRVWIKHLILLHVLPALSSFLQLLVSLFLAPRPLLGQRGASRCSRLGQCLKHSTGRPAWRCPVASSPCMTSFSICDHPSFCAHKACSSQCNRCWQRRICMLRQPACSSTAALKTSPCHVIRRRPSVLCSHWMVRLE